MTLGLSPRSALSEPDTLVTLRTLLSVSSFLYLVRLNLHSHTDLGSRPNTNTQDLQVRHVYLEMSPFSVELGLQVSYSPREDLVTNTVWDDSWSVWTRVTEEYFRGGSIQIRAKKSGGNFLPLVSTTRERVPESMYSDSVQSLGFRHDDCSGGVSATGVRLLRFHSREIKIRFT